MHNLSDLRNKAVDSSNQLLALEKRLRDASERELRLAAEAVVDAAIWRRRLRAETLGAEPDVSEETRLALIELVFEDPSFTPYLFQDEAWERH